jgi:hypothetical protein
MVARPEVRGRGGELASCGCPQVARNCESRRTCSEARKANHANLGDLADNGVIRRTQTRSKGALP